MSHLVDGLPCHGHRHFPKALRVQCALCDEAKAKHQPFPDASTTQYILVFIVHHSLYAITILHKDSTDFVGVLRKAIAKAGFTPKHIQCDGAGEYVGGKLAEFLDANNITLQFSCPLEQYGN
eukprot:3937283-Rhodomonas_salina.1